MCFVLLCIAVDGGVACKCEGQQPTLDQFRTFRVQKWYFDEIS